MLPDRHRRAIDRDRIDHGAQSRRRGSQGESTIGWVRSMRLPIGASTFEDDVDRTRGAMTGQPHPPPRSTQTSRPALTITSSTSGSRRGNRARRARRGVPPSVRSAPRAPLGWRAARRGRPARRRRRERRRARPPPARTRLRPSPPSRHRRAPAASCREPRCVSESGPARAPATARRRRRGDRRVEQDGGDDGDAETCFDVAGRARPGSSTSTTPLGRVD